MGKKRGDLPALPSGEQPVVERVLAGPVVADTFAGRTRIAGFFAQLRKTAEQLTALERWYRILTQALKKFLRGRKLVPPRQLPAGATSYG